MAKHALDGDVTAFFWGQGYGGTLRGGRHGPALRGSRLDWLRRGSSRFGLTGVAAVLVWRVGLRTIDPRARGCRRRALLGVAVLFDLEVHARARLLRRRRGAALLVLLLVLRLAERPTKTDAAALGLVVGVGLWQSAQLLPIAARGDGVAHLAQAGSAVGWRRSLPGAPFSASCRGRSRTSATTGGRSRSRRLPARTPAASAARGRRPANGLRAAGALHVSWSGRHAIAGTAMAGASTLAFVVVACEDGVRTNVSLLVAVASRFPFIAATSTFTWIVDEPRYLYIVSPVLVLLVSLCSDDVAACRSGAVGRDRLDVLRHLPHERLAVLWRARRRDVRARRLRAADRPSSTVWASTECSPTTGSRTASTSRPTSTSSPPRRTRARSPRAVRAPCSRPDPTTRTGGRSTTPSVRRVDAPAGIFRAGSTRDRRWTPLLRRAGYRRILAGDFVVWHRGQASTGT